MKSPKLTVVIPLGPGKNRIDNVARILNEVNYSSLQMIVIQDTADVAEIDYAKKIIDRNRHENLILDFVSFNNPGLTRNYGMNFARGKWIAFWDSDDDPQISEFLLMIDEAERNNSDVAIGAFNIVDESTSHEIHISTGAAKTSLGLYLAAYPGIWRFGFKMSYVAGTSFHPFKMGEDQLFLLEAIKSTKNVYLHEGPVYRYHVGNTNQLTSESDARNKIRDSYSYLLQNRNLLETTTLRISASNTGNERDQAF